MSRQKAKYKDRPVSQCNETVKIGSLIQPCGAPTKHKSGKCFTHRKLNSNQQASDALTRVEGAVDRIFGGFNS